MTLSPTRARALARSILSHPPFHASARHPPNPLGGFFDTLGRGLHFVLGGFLTWLGHHFFGPVGSAFDGADGPVVTILAVVAALGLGATVGGLLWRRRAQHISRRTLGGLDLESRASASDLEQWATTAVARGEFALAVRWWFQAGVERLTEIGVVANGRSRTERQLRAVIDDEVFAGLADAHERIVYGEQPATADDAAHAESGWSEVISHAARHRGARVGAP